MSRRKITKRRHTLGREPLRVKELELGAALKRVALNRGFACFVLTIGAVIGLAAMNKSDLAEKVLYGALPFAGLAVGQIVRRKGS